jgi:hypothetical protein
MAEKLLLSRDNFLRVDGILDLPLETVCNILIYLSPMETLTFAKTSRCSLNIFYFNLSRIIDQLLNEWHILIFKCPRCGLCIRNGGQVSISTLSIPSDGRVKEELTSVCRKCFLAVRKESMSRLYSLLVRYRSDRDHSSEYRHLAYEGMCRYQSGGRYPRKKDYEFMKNIVTRIFDRDEGRSPKIPEKSKICLQAR